MHDHLTVKVYPQSKMTINYNSKSYCQNQHHPLSKRKAFLNNEQDKAKRRYTITNMTIPETKIYHSVSNQAYEQPMMQKPVPNQNILIQQRLKPKVNYSSTLSANIENRSMDFRPLIINGRRKFRTLPSSSSMIIIKKRPHNFSSDNSFIQKSITRSIPVNIIKNDMTGIITSRIPSSLAYSSLSKSSTLPTNVGTVFLPIQVTRSQKNNINNNSNNNNNKNIKYSTINTKFDGQKNCHYVQKQVKQEKFVPYIEIANKTRHDDDFIRSTQIPSSRSFNEEGNNFSSTIIMDSHVSRLIRRYDPVSSNTTGVKQRRSFDNIRNAWHTIDTAIEPIQPLQSSPLFTHRSLTTAIEESSPKQQETHKSHLQHQHAIDEHEHDDQQNNSSIVRSPRPILKYGSRSRSEFIVQPHQIEPLTIQIDQPISPSKENPVPYQPLITTATKRVCSALTKSEWDLRVQNEQLNRSSSPNNQIQQRQEEEQEQEQEEQQTFRSTSDLNQAAIISDNQDDNFDENSLPILSHGSCVEKLKKLFVSRSSSDLTNPSINNQHRNDSVDSNLSRNINFDNRTRPSENSNESEQLSIVNTTTNTREVTPTSSSLSKKPILKSQKAIDSTETVTLRQSSPSMPLAEVSHDAYRFHRLNDSDQTIIKQKSVAKVEPYSINADRARSLHQSSLSPNSTQQISAANQITASMPNKSRIQLNSMGNTPTNSSTSSSVASLSNVIRQPNSHHSDFLMPITTYVTPQPLSNTPSIAAPLNTFLESSSHGSSHQLSKVNIPSYDERSLNLPSAINNTQQKTTSISQGDFHSGMNLSTPSIANNLHPISSTSHHYRPTLTTVIDNDRHQTEIPRHAMSVEPQNELFGYGQQPIRRRFHKRKQMKRSKSVDLCQEPTILPPPPTPSNINQLQRISQPQKPLIQDYVIGEENLSPSPSSSSSSLTADIERVNQAVLLRYKSLDSMTYNKQKLNENGKKHTTTTNQRKLPPKQIVYDIDSDDSVCGIPKPRRLCTSSKNIAKSGGPFVDTSLADRNQVDNVRPISNPNIINSSTSTGITNSIPKNEIITNERIYPTIEPPPSKENTHIVSTLNDRKEGEVSIEQAKISLAESQFYARTSNSPCIQRHDTNIEKSIEIDSVIINNKNQIDHREIKNDPITSIKYNEEEKHEETPTTINFISNERKTRPLSNSIIINPFERLRPMNVQNENIDITDDLSTKIIEQTIDNIKQDEVRRETPPKSINLARPLQTSLEHIQQQQFDETNDSSTSTTTLNGRSIHLPVEKQRGLSEIVRKRNSRCKVEDYKRSIQKSNTIDDQRVFPSSKSDYELTSLSNNTATIASDTNSKHLNKTHSIDIPVDIESYNGSRAKLSIERLNQLLSSNEQFEQTDISNDIDEESMTVADKRNLFETILKDKQFGGTLPRSKTSKTENSILSKSTSTKKYINENHRSKTENILHQYLNDDNNSEMKQDSETFDDEISKLSFREKMTLFNNNMVNKSIDTTQTSLKTNRNRLTQPITIEEVQAAANLNISSNIKQIDLTHSHETNVSYLDESENKLPVNTKFEEINVFIESQPEKNPSTHQTKTLKYGTTKANTDQQQRAKTVDIIRLKNDSTAKPKEQTQKLVSTNKNNETRSNNNDNVNVNVLSILKSDTVSVLKPDDHFDEFFSETKKNSHDEPTIQLNTDDLNRIAENTVRLQSQAARVRPPRRQQQGAKNPLRQIQATIPTENEYTEIHTNLSEQEFRRLKRAQIAEHAGIAQEALAAITKIENFAEINLRKVDQSPMIKFGFEPYNDLMLILVKGRRQCSLRLVNPTYKSINEGDCYLLVTPLKVFAWLGRYANVVEKTKAIDLIEYLKQHRDLGLRNEVKYFVLDQGKDDTENDSHAEFRDILNGETDDYKSVDDTIDDEFYETNLIELNRVYRVENDLLMPLNDICFHSISIKILDPNEVFVFDFGSELYVWNGKFADKTKRSMGLQLAQQLWNDSYDYTDSIINPFDPLDDDDTDPNNLIGTNRPIWCIFGKQNQNVETILFKGKFSDWPFENPDTKSANEINNKIQSIQRPPSIADTLKPADVQKMLLKSNNPINFIVEQVNIGRGRYWYDPISMRTHDIKTLSLNVWHISDNERNELSQGSYGQFYSDDVYIIRWKYKLLSNVNHTTISEKKNDINRDRVVYWIWQGYNASPSEKGISALMTVFINEEKGPNVHVLQEHEEAAFLQLFDGTLAIHMGKRNQMRTNKSNWRLYIFLGEIDVETHWWEINVNCENLRSRTSFLLINNAENLLLLWHGCATTEDQQILANRSAMKLRDKCPDEFHFDGQSGDIEFFEMQEGDEIELFWDGINQRDHRRKYHSLLNVHSNQELLSTMRIFHFSSLHGPFVAQEIPYTLRSLDHVSAFPFKQSDLYELHQPALCLIDADHELFVWQGWNDQSDDELGMELSNANLLVRGPTDIRFTAERRCAFLTAVDYYKAKTSLSTVDIPCSIVYAGLEPIEFINLFPKWSVHKKARKQNQMDGKHLNQKDSVMSILNQLCRDQYSIHELRARPLPEGVDPSKIESYLSDIDFQKEFNLTKEEFYALPYWKQTNIKKQLGFF